MLYSLFTIGLTATFSQYTDWRHQLLVLYHDNREHYWAVVTFYVMFCAAFFPPHCTNGLLNLPIHIQLSVRKPSLLWKVLSLWTAYSVSVPYTVWIPAQSLQGSIFPWTETFHAEEGFLVLDGARDAESRCWCWSSANMCRRPGTRMVRMKREREMFAF